MKIYQFYNSWSEGSAESPTTLLPDFDQKLNVAVESLSPQSLHFYQERPY